MRNISHIKLNVVLLLTSIIIATNCATILKRKAVATSSSLNTHSSEIKLADRVYLKNGELLITDSLFFDTSLSLLHVWGKRYNTDRQLIGEGHWKFHQDSVALIVLDTYDKVIYPSLVVSGISVVSFVAVSILCITNPKACYGSCPVFYVPMENEWIVTGEGFSDAIYRHREKTDIDKIVTFTPTETHLPLMIKNEALETHYITHVKLLAIPKRANETVYADPSETTFWVTTNEQPVSQAFVNDNEEITELIRKRDNKPYLGSASAKNLSHKEEIMLKFTVDVAGHKGLIMSFKQSLMTTFIFYSGLSYMGDLYMDWLAYTETPHFDFKKEERRLKRLSRIMAKIELYLDDKKIKEFEISEGPIAWLNIAIDLGHIDTGEHELIIRSTKGFWKFDYFAIADIKETNKYIEIHSTQHDSIFPLVLLPGDSIILDFYLPRLCFPDRCDIFIESRGFYHEWPRYEWILNKSLAKLWLLRNLPKVYFAQIAKEYKAIEDSIEHAFWNSKYNHTRHRDIQISSK